MFLSPGSRARSTKAAFPRGTVLLFYQAAAPQGWVKLTTQNDKALRVVSGGTGGTAGGTNAFSTVFAQTVVGNTSLSTAQLASHTHATGNVDNTAFGNTLFAGGASGLAAGFNIGANGSGAAHNHTITMSIQFIDIILCQKS